MKKTWSARIVCLIMLFAIALPPATSSAARITSSSLVQYYKEPNADAVSDTMNTIPAQEATEVAPGWYKIWDVGTYYVKASDVTFLDPTPSPTPSYTPTPTPVPGAPTPTPTPETLDGEKDPTYEGEILNYTVPAGGLWLYDAPNGKTTETIAAGATVKLTETKGEPGWYSVYYKGKTYYVPGSILYVNPSSTADISKTASVVLNPGTVYLFSVANPWSGANPPDLNANKTNHTLQGGVRVNAKYYNQYWYSYQLDGKTYYIYSGDVEGGKNSTAGVTSNEDTTLMREFKVKNGTTLYRVMDLTSANSHVIQTATTLYGVRVDDNWFRVMYQSETFYLPNNTQIESSTQVAVSDATNSATYWVTVGSNGAYLYSTRVRNATSPELGSVGKLDPGQSILASPVDTMWYSYSSGGKLYYIYSGDLGTSSSSSSMTSYRVFLPSGTALYDKTTATNPTSITLTSAAMTVSGVNGDYYVVQSFNDTWYSITYDGKLYYIKKSDAAASSTKSITLTNATLYMYDYDQNGNNQNSATNMGQYSGKLTIETMISTQDQGKYPTPPSGSKWYCVVLDATNNTVKYLIATSDGSSSIVTDNDSTNPFATTTAGKQYYVTIGMASAQLYRDAACTQPATQTIGAGEVILATKYTDSLYIVTSSGAQYYLPVRYIVSIKGGDDASAVNPSGSSETINDIAKGEANSNFTGEVFSYKIPAGGLWLYYKADPNSRAQSLNYGSTIQLTRSAANASWYTTWYAGAQYFVPETALQVSDTDTTVNGTYTITVKNTIKVYNSASFNANGSPMSGNTASGVTLNAGAKVNVRVMSKTTGGVTIYAYTHYDNKTYYFTSVDVEPNSAISATIDSNSSASFITQFVFTYDAATGIDTVNLYSSPTTTSGYAAVSFAAKPLTIYGVTYDSTWYKVIHNNETWYLKRADYLAIAQAEPDQISVSTNSATSTTYTVVIGTAEVKLYTRPDATNNTYYTGHVLLPGESILASKVNSAWYSCAMNGTTYYFQATATANNNSTAAINSYVIKIDVNDGVKLYNTVSSTGLSVLTLPTGTYTMRKINSEWSSVYYGGTTYYVKNAALPDDAVNESTPIASTTVGKTYKITIGKGGAAVYSNSKLTGTKQGTLAGGHQTTGTKLYVAGADAANAPDGLVFSVSYGGKQCYISAGAVSGVAEGDEVDEAKKAAEDAAKDGTSTPIAIGTTTLFTFNIGTTVYTSQSTSGTTFSIPSTTTMNATKVNTNWYSLSYGGVTYYIPATSIEGDGTTTKRVTVSVGESYTLTFTSAAWCFKEPDDTSTLMETILVGETHVIKRVSDAWYEVNYGGNTYYIKASQIVLPLAPVTPTTPTTPTTTDGTGYITAYLTVSVTSGTLRLRKTASTSATVLDSIPNGAQIKNNGYTVDSSKKVWYNVTYNGRTGYVLGDFVKPVGTATIDGTTSANPAADIGKSFLVNTAKVNVRSGAGMTYSILGYLDKNVSVTPIDYAVGSDNMTWYKFQFTASVTAWIRSDYLAGSAISSMEQSGNVAIKAGGTNVRSGPGDSFSIVVQLPRDTIVSIIGKGTDSNETLWYRVMYNSVSGYVRSDLVRSLTAAETSQLMASVISQYNELKFGSKGTEVKALQEKLISLGHMAAGSADGIYGTKTTNGVKAYQASKGLSQTGVATAALQAQLFNTASTTGTGTTQSLDWFTTGYTLINANKNVTIYDINSGITWNARYINGANHADIIPASKADATKLTANSIVGSYVRRPVIVTIAGQKFAGSMYARGHGETNYCDYFAGVMCIHFTGSKTHGTNNVDADHQAAIQAAINSGL